jgi:hypothetical protein
MTGIHISILATDLEKLVEMEHSWGEVGGFITVGRMKVRY